MRKSSRRAVVLLLLLAAAQAHAQQYRWVDEKGRVQYTDTPPPATAKDVQKKRLDVGKSDGPAQPYALQTARKGAPVKLYSSPDCADCDKARAFLNKRGIPFEEISIVFDSQTAELTKLTGRASVPVMIVGRAMQRGFDESEYEQQLDVAGYPKRGTLPERNQAAPTDQRPPKPVPAAPAAPAAPATR